MIKYGLDRVTELKFNTYDVSMEKRDGGQWIDIMLRFELDEGTPAPDDLIDFSGLVITTLGGAIAQIVPQDEDTDCEYQFTTFEKEQIRAFIESPEIQLQIANLSSPM
ncbi:hypothetical protein [Paenibacillus radicis (ex Gao et al. 2016)]|uniref:Uncharacterized protein n=1 Tax=Paenibacillus radicis (ex Gao et al. 2016) TaxID=1737354 RepID=A0A917HTB2_9BACL|nr:hypothetical protein [Paenibacillus radicis (ex Gao et al. 2016)]GGG88305.1 hypothetical protein GCM10010918_53490 [Paenibacillus radicis (ex Gao et al. 2016)]